MPQANAVNTSKLNTYTVLEQAAIEVSKLNTYVVLAQPILQTTKLNLYAVLEPGANQRRRPIYTVS